MFFRLPWLKWVEMAEAMEMVILCLHFWGACHCYAIQNARVNRRKWQVEICRMISFAPLRTGFERLLWMSPHFLSELLYLLRFWKYYFLNKVRVDAKIVWRRFMFHVFVNAGAHTTLLLLCPGCTYLEQITCKQLLSFWCKNLNNLCHYKDPYLPSANHVNNLCHFKDPSLLRASADLKMRMRRVTCLFYSFLRFSASLLLHVFFFFGGARICNSNTRPTKQSCLQSF